MQLSSILKDIEISRGNPQVTINYIGLNVFEYIKELILKICDFQCHSSAVTTASIILYTYTMPCFLYHHILPYKPPPPPFGKNPVYALIGFRIFYSF
jgi:hypothetical protein